MIKKSKLSFGKKVKQLLKDKPKKGFDCMSRKERKAFLSNHLIAKMILLEQKSSASMGKVVAYDKTNYYKSLSKKEKDKYEKYLKRKRRRRFYLPGIFFVIFILFVLLKGGFTGQVIRENLGETTESFLEIALALIFLLIILFLIISFGMEGFNVRRFIKYFKILGGKYKKS